MGEATSDYSVHQVDPVVAVASSPTGWAPRTASAALTGAAET
jgi:hypothetical protein